STPLEPLSLHDALPIFAVGLRQREGRRRQALGRVLRLLTGRDPPNRRDRPCPFSRVGPAGRRFPPIVALVGVSRPGAVSNQSPADRKRTRLNSSHVSIS